MAYCLQADVEQSAGGPARLKQLCDWDNNNAVDAGVVDKAIAKADALINSYATKHFTVPFNPVPPIIAQHSADLAKLYLIKSRRSLDDAEQREWDAIAGTQKGNEGWLLLLAQGVVTPGTDPMPTKHGTMAVDSVETTLPSDRDVSREKLADFW